MALWMCLACCASGAALGCEVVGFSFSEPVSARELFEDFRYRGRIHRDGWGVALYRDRSAQLIKDEKPSMESDLAEFLTRYRGLQAEIFIGFVRAASPGCGGPSHQNCHPFLRELDGRDFVLAHEGTIYGFREKLKLGYAQPLGINDSEFLCCYLAGRIKEAGIRQWNEKSLAWLDGLLADIGLGPKSSVTSMFSDGEYLFVYLDRRDPNDLFYVRRDVPHPKVFFTNMQREVDLAAVYPPSAKGMIIATRPLTSEKWTPLAAGTLTVLRKGEIVYRTPAK